MPTEAQERYEQSTTYSGRQDPISISAYERGIEW